MTDQPQGGDTTARGGDRRDRTERRRTDRRTPLPLWRRPLAYVAYGVVGALLLFAVFGSLGGDNEDGNSETADPGTVVTTAAPLSVDSAQPPAASRAVQNAYSVADYERLLAQGQGAVGQRVRTTLFCGGIDPIALKDDATRLNSSVAALADADRQVPGAECEWGPDRRGENFLLLVPPQLVTSFARSPEVRRGFIRRRRVNAELEWIGRSEALALRNVGVLRSVAP